MPKMLNKLIICLVSFALFLELFPPLPVAASAQFSTGYDISFNFAPNGTAQATQKISLTNLTSNFYASEYSLTIGSEKVSNATGSDSLGSIPITTKVQNGSTSLVATLNQKVVGQNKVSSFQINYTIDGLAVKRGRVWEVNIPQIVTSENVSSYKLNLAVPKTFGPLGKITPNFVSKEENGEKVIYLFDKTSLSASGIGANFGDYQEFKFTLKYRYKNTALYSAKATIALPPDTEYQALYFQSLDPRPEKLRLDESGNYLADYTVKAKKNLEVIVKGLVKIVDSSTAFQEPQTWTDAELEKFTKNDRFIDSNNQKILQKAKELAGPKEIYDYVSSTLKYDYSRLKSDNLGRRGALAAFNKPEQSICTDYSDLFVALARAKRIPARGLVGFAYTDNTNLRPTKVEGLVNTTILHAWPEYYDRGLKRWIQVDPTWGSTTGGIDYFDRLDTNHFVFAINGTSSQEPLPAGAYKLSSDQVDDVQVEFSTTPITIEPKVSLNLAVNQVISGFPSTSKLIIENSSGRALFGAKLTVAASSILGLADPRETDLGIIMPFSKQIVPIKLRSNSLLDSNVAALEIKLQGRSEKPLEVKINKQVKVQPFFSLSWQQLVLVALVILVTLSWVYPHWRSRARRVEA